jgi:exopolysaccharide production protein ExoQ
VHVGRLTTFRSDSTGTAFGTGADTAPAAAMAVHRTRIEVVLAVAILIESSRAAHNWYPLVGLISDGKLTSLGRLVWPMCALGSGIAIFRRPWLDRRSLDPLMVVTIALLSASFLWSVDATKTLYQAIVLFSLAVCGAFLAIAFTRRELVALVSNTLGVVCAANVIAILAGVNFGEGTTTGFFEHKNILGLVAAVALLVNVARVATADRSRLVVLSTAFSAIALSLSGSRTSQFGTALALITIGFITIRRHHQLVAFALLAPMTALYALGMRATGGFAAILTASGKSSDLTGRTEIWSEVTRLIGERPIVGWGFLAYWRDAGFGEGRSGFEEFGLRSAHSGYLEVGLGAGTLALALLVVTLITLLVRSYRRCAEPAPPAIDYALFGLALFTATVNVSETLFPATTRTILTLLLFAFSASPTMRER